MSGALPLLSLRVVDKKKCCDAVNLPLVYRPVVARITNNDINKHILITLFSISLCLCEANKYCRTLKEKRMIDIQCQIVDLTSQ